MNTVIFVTNGEHNIVQLTDPLDYIAIRRAESQAWLSKVAPNAEIHYLHLRDGLGIEDISKSYGHSIFESLNGKTILQAAHEKIVKIVGSNTVLFPNSEPHPSHNLTHFLCEQLSNKRIYYSVHSLFKYNEKRKPGVHYSHIKLHAYKYHSYLYVYSSSDFEEKKKEFQIYYNSQSDVFEKTGLKLTNWETYLSEVPLKLDSEDRTYQYMKVIL